jgi:hypothetical protein
LIRQVHVGIFGGVFWIAVADLQVAGGSIGSIQKMVYEQQVRLALLYDDRATVETILITKGRLKQPASP